MFDPRLFSHGRVLHRYDGSDAARFSPTVAHGLLGRIARDATRPPILWDPVCGSGLIPAIAALFFPGAFRTVIASDLDPAAVDCTRRNLALVTDGDAARQRVHALRGMARRNPASARRRGAVADYLETLLPRIDANDTPVEVLVADAFALPDRGGPVHYIGDLPYGQATHLVGGTTQSLLDALAYPGSQMTLAMRAEDAGDAGLPLRGGRAILRG